MGKIPEDAAHWDSGDWIEWHRVAPETAAESCSSAAQDPLARLTAMHVSLMRAAKGYYEMTGHHLPVYDVIAQVHAAIHCDIPLEGPDRHCEETGVELLHLPPFGPSKTVEVDLERPFKTLIVVRIKENFTTEAKMIPRSSLPDTSEGLYSLGWRSLPHRI